MSWLIITQRRNPLFHKNPKEDLTKAKLFCRNYSKSFICSIHALIAQEGGFVSISQKVKGIGCWLVGLVSPCVPLTLVYPCVPLCTSLYPWIGCWVVSPSHSSMFTEHFAHVELRSEYVCCSKILNAKSVLSHVLRYIVIVCICIVVILYFYCICQSAVSPSS